MMNVEQILKRREELIKAHQDATIVMEQTRGAIAIIDELLRAAEDPPNVETAGDIERQLSS